MCAASKTIWFSAALGLILCSVHDPVTEYQLITFHNNVAWINFEVQEEALYKALCRPDSCCLSGTPAGRSSPGPSQDNILGSQRANCRFKKGRPGHGIHSLAVTCLSWHLPGGFESRDLREKKKKPEVLTKSILRQFPTH